MPGFAAAKVPTNDPVVTQIEMCARCRARSIRDAARVRCHLLGTETAVAAKSHNIVQNRKWRATVDEDGHCAFAVAL
jgi:hypothetical protein